MHAQKAEYYRKSWHKDACTEKKDKTQSTIQRNNSEDREEKRGEDTTVLDVITEIFRNQGNVKGKLSKGPL